MAEVRFTLRFLRFWSSFFYPGLLCTVVHFVYCTILVKALLLMIHCMGRISRHKKPFFQKDEKTTYVGGIGFAMQPCLGQWNSWRWAGPLLLLWLLMELAANILGDLPGLCTQYRDPLFPSYRAVVLSAGCDVDVHSSLLSCWPHKHSST